MNLKKIILAVAALVLSHACVGFAEDEVISDEDVEVIQVLEILKDLDLLEEDLDFLETMTEIGEDDEIQTTVE
jgi:hypothetical protein